MNRFARFITALVAVAVVAGYPQSALAYTQVRNHFDSNPNDYFCGGDSSIPCLFWSENPRTVITIRAFLDSSLNLGYYNFQSVLLNQTFPDYNTDPAYNPSFSACYTFDCGTIIYEMAPLTFCGQYGTAYSRTGADSSRYGQPWQDSNGQWDAYWLNLSSTQLIQFNSSVTWNSGYGWTFNCSNPPNEYVNGDGRKAAGHETGHISSLGHTCTSPCARLMYADPSVSGNFYVLQSNDVAGLQEMYPGWCCPKFH